MSKIANFGCEMLRNVENIAFQSLQILYTFVLCAAGSNFCMQYKSITNLQTLQGYIFHILQHFATKICNSTHFSKLFLAVVIYLHLFA